MKEKEWFLGLDMGTASVGWAVTNPQYELLRAKGKDLWGIREFEEADSASDRRGFRSNRRRRQREQVRIGLLQDYFHDDIYKIDPNFYQRLANSFYHEEDKNPEVRGKNDLFDDASFTDVDYYKKYKTIFHLRSELIHDQSPHDVRLVYLAIHNIFKHRGHFLNAGLSEEAEKVDLNEAYFELRTVLLNTTDISLPESFEMAEFQTIMCDRGISRKEKAERIANLWKIDKKTHSGKSSIELIHALTGLNADARKIFSLDSEEKIEICFSDAAFDDKIADISDALGEEYFSVISLLKTIYDTCAWDMVINGYDYLSDARVASYDKHHNDLKKLKDVFRKYKTKADYDRFFRSEEKGTYGDYAGSNNSGKKHRRGSNGAKKHQLKDFYASVRAELKNLPSDDVDVAYILAEIDKGRFMPKQLTGNNGIIPYQAHYKELKAILRNAQEYLPFLKEKHKESGLTVSEEILEIFRFRVPYYIGPVTEKSEENHGNGWVVRKEEGAVRPWNIDLKIDIEKTSEKFISRLVRKCTYIAGEQVLPKSSLLYERFSVLNAINNITIDGERLSTSLKQEIFSDLFTNGKVVTKKKLCRYLLNRGFIEEENQVGGIDERINNTCSSYKKFFDIFGKEMEKDNCRQMTESIIYWSTIFGESKEYLKRKLQDLYGDQLSKKQIKRILSLKFRDWGNLSRAFLLLPGMDKQTGESMSLIQALWETQLNLNELIYSERYTFKDELNKRTVAKMKPLNEFSIEDLEGMYFSAPVKRMVWQTLLVIKELVQVMGCAPTRIFVEVTRGKGKKERTITRKQKFLDLYKNLKEESKNWTELINEADADGKIRSKKMYLYLLQKGVDLYTGKTIPLDSLFDNNLYDIDHIYPQSLTKDDNLDNNMILTEKTFNNDEKQDKYPLDPQVRASRFPLWKELHAQGFINDEKFKRLTGREGFTDDQLAGFIARQMVETNQGTKAVAELLQSLMPRETKVIYSKARAVSDFRQKFSLLKSRTLNDFHHANDAYLNIVVGNAYYVKFTDNPRRFISQKYKKDKIKYHYNLKELFKRDIKNERETAWKGPSNNGAGEGQESIITVRKMLGKGTPLLSRMCFVGHGKMFDQTLYSAESAAKGNGYVSLKGSEARMDPTKYGGYTRAATAYFFLVESGSDKKRVRTLEVVPLYLAEKIEKNPECLKEYCIKQLELKKPSIRLSKISLHSLLNYDGYFLYITGKTLNRLTVKNATSLILDQTAINYIKKLEKYIDKNELDQMITKEKNIGLYKQLLQKHTSGIFMKRPNAVGEKLEKHLDAFGNLSVWEEVKVLLEIIRMTSIGTNGQGDLTGLNEAKKSGIMLIPKKITGRKKVRLINQSVTGIYEKSIDLLKI